MGTDTEIDNGCDVLESILIDYTIYEEITIYVPEFKSCNKCNESKTEQWMSDIKC